MAIYVGIEEDEHSIRAAIVRTQFGRAQLVRYLELWLSQVVPPPVVEGSAAPSPRALALAEVLRAAGAAEIVASMPIEELSLRRIELPAVAARKLDELLPFELEAVVPFEAESALIEHQPVESGDPSKIALLACVVPRARVRARLDELASVGLDPLALAPSAASLAGIATFSPELASASEPVLLVSVGLDRMELAVVQKGKCDFARSIGVGHRQVDAIGYGEPSLAQDAEQLARELRQTIASYRLQGGADPLAVRVVGLVDPEQRIVAWLAAVLDREASLLELPSPSGAGAKEPAAALDPIARARFGAALGLVGHALERRTIDLRVGEFTRARKLGRVRELAPLLAAATAAIFVAWGFSVYAQYSVLEARRQVLEGELARISRTHLGQETTDVAEARELLARGRANPDPMPRWTALDALIAVSGAIPDTIRHDVQRMQIDLAQDRSEGHFELQGIVGSIEESDRVREALSHITCFQNLEQAGPATPAADGRRQYRLEADIRCPDDRRATDTRGRRRQGSSSSGGGR